MHIYIYNVAYIHFSVSFSQVAAIGQEVMALNCARGSSGWRLGNISTPKEQCCSGTAAQGGGGVTISGGVQGTWGCGTEGCGQWARWGGLGLDLGI